MFEKEGVQYHRELLHSVSKRKGYSGTTSKALNLGVYGADLSYSGLFGQHEAAIQYFATSHIIADDLGISTTFQNDFIARLEDHPGNKDTLLAVVSDFFIQNNKDLKESESQDLSSYVLVGGWIEGMYLGTKFVNKEANATGVRNIITNQRDAINNLVLLLNNIKTEPATESIVKELEVIKEVYERTEGEITDEDLSIITLQIESIREYILGLT